MDPLSAVGVWVLSLVGIAALVCAARRAGAVHDLRMDDDRGFHEQPRRGRRYDDNRFPDVVTLAGAHAALTAVITLPLWG
jgi:hypothetical protein